MSTTDRQTTRSHRPKALMVFAVAFIAGAVAAVGINRTLDVHLAQSKPKVESEPIFVALRSLPPGTPVTIWDVALRDWPKAMMPSTALRAHDHFEGMILRHPLREGQPLLSVQLASTEPVTPGQLAPSGQPNHIAQGIATRPSPAAVAQPAAPAEADLWASTTETVTPSPAAPSVPATPPSIATDNPPIAPPPSATVAAPVPSAAHGEPTMAEPLAEPPQPAQPAEAVSVVTGPPAAAPIVPAQPGSPSPAAPAASQSFVRYLVVPERIAMQADQSFTTPAAAAAAASAAGAPPVGTPTAAKPTETVAPATVKKDVPPVAQHPGQRRTKPAPTAKQASGTTSVPSPRQPPRAPSMPPQNSRTNGSHATPPAQTSRPQSTFGSMFPNLRAGIEAVEAEMRRGRQEPADDPQAPPQPRKTKPHPPSQGAAGWPRMGSSSPRAF